MKIDRRLVATGATLVVALGAGHLVQNSHRQSGNDIAVSRLAGAQTAPSAAPQSVEHIIPLSAAADLGTASTTVTLPYAPRAARERPAFETEPRRLAERMSSVERSGPQLELELDSLNQYGMPCEVSFAATPSSAGMVELSLSAPCHPDERVEVIHDQLRFAASMSNTGEFQVSVPALTPNAVFVVEFPDGSMSTAVADVPLAGNYERVALQGPADNAMHLHAYEFGAEYYDDGHVWAGAPRQPVAGYDANGGFLTSLGEPGLLNALVAEVYSYPQGQTHDSGVVRVSVEAEVTPTNCGQEIAGNTLQPGYDGQMQQAEITLAMPPCDAVGEFIVLKNVVRDLKIASN